MARSVDELLQAADEILKNTGVHPYTPAASNVAAFANAHTQLALAVMKKEELTREYHRARDFGPD